MSYVRSGVLIAIIVFAAFTAYAFLAPATYRTNALVVVDSAEPAVLVELPQPMEAARRLGEAILDRKTLEKLSADRAGSSAPEARAQAASSVRQSLEIDTSDGHTFSIGYRDVDAARTQASCKLLAHRAAEVAPIVLIDKGAVRALDQKRQQQTQELAAFLALHPEVAAEAPPTGDKSPDKDPVMSAFRAEKSNLEQRIAEVTAGIDSDNPYIDAKDSDLGQLKRRLREIDSGLSSRRQALEAKPSGAPALSAELRAEWKRLLDSVSRASSEAETAPRATLTARVANEAALPSSPVDPNRRLLLFFGVVFGAGLGAAFALAMRSTQQRRLKSSRPPPAAPPAAPPVVHVPAAPALPSGMGPSVPLLALPAPAQAPPIVPMQQRPISSNPPPANLGTAQAKQGSERPPVRRFASTLVLPPAENPTPVASLASLASLASEDTTPDPVLASAAHAWDLQIRAHDVPGFAVVKAGSEPPPPLATPSEPPAPPKPISSGPPPAATIQRTTSRPPNQMKVTQPLGSFVQEALWAEATKRASSSAPPPQSARSQAPSRSPSPVPASQYSYVSSAPGAPTSNGPPSSSAQRVAPVRVQAVPQSWRPDPSLTPQAQRGLCEQLYPYAVESCFVLAVVSVPESTGYKSRVAAELALGLAESGHPRILLLEGDHQRPWCNA